MYQEIVVQRTVIGDGVTDSITIDCIEDINNSPVHIKIPSVILSVSSSLITHVVSFSLNRTSVTTQFASIVPTSDGGQVSIGLGM